MAEFRPAVMERPYAGAHLLLDPDVAAVLKQLAKTEQRAMKFVAQRAILQYAAIQAARTQ